MTDTSVTAEDYFEDAVENDDLEFLELLLEDDTTVRIRLNTGTPVENYAAEIFDTVLEQAPPLREPITLYKDYSYPALRNGGDMVENAFFNGTTEKMGAGTTIGVTVPAGTKALRLGEAGYLLPRGAKLSLKPTSVGVIPALLTGFSTTVFTSPGLAPKTLDPETKDLDPKNLDPKNLDPKNLDPKNLDPKNLDPKNLAAEDVEEFFNPFHAKDGRFGTGRGGGGGHADAKKLTERYGASKATEAEYAAQRKQLVKDVGKKVLKAAVITAVVIGTLMIARKAGGVAVQHHEEKVAPGAHVHSYYQDDGGPTLHLIDNTRQISFGRGQKMLKDLAEVNKVEPLASGKAPRILVKEKGIFMRHAVAFAFMDGKSTTIHINREAMDDTGTEKAFLDVMGDDGKRFFMPGFKKDRPKHLVTHEYGHLHDAHMKRSLGPVKGRMYTRKREKMFERTKANPTLSGYGKTNPAEAYAETFADFHTSKGQTTSSASKAYAKEFGWS